MAITTCELQWLKDLFYDLGVTHFKRITLYCDNKATLHIATDLVFYEHTKNIKSKCHFIWDKIQFGLLHTHRVLSNHQLTNVFTKGF